MPERPGSSATPEPDQPALRAGTWQPRPRARHARPGSDGDDPLRLSPDELPWGIPARAAAPDAQELPPPTVLASRRRTPRVLIVTAGGVVILVLLVLVLAVLL